MTMATIKLDVELIAGIRGYVENVHSLCMSVLDGDPVAVSGMIQMHMTTHIMETIIDTVFVQQLDAPDLVTYLEMLAEDDTPGMQD